MALRSQWEKEVNVFPRVHVKNVVGFDRIQAIKDEAERDYLLKTKFDFVICKKHSGVPILVIEFDGMDGGFSRVLEYETHKVPIRDQHRRRKLEAKLRICAEAEIPAVVVSSQETTHIDVASRLTILDGIIGKVLASELFTQICEEREFNSLDEVEDLEFTLHQRKNPIEAEITRLMTALITVERGTSLPKLQTPLSDRKNVGEVGCRTVVECGGQEFAADIYVRDINCRGFVAYGLAVDLSWLTALREAVRATRLITSPDGSSSA